MNRLSTIRRIILPGFVFQSVVIAGGYGTGRELAEFFLMEGPVGGLLAMGVSTLLWSLVYVVPVLTLVFGESPGPGRGSRRSPDLGQSPIRADADNGPRARIGNAHPHPSASARLGTL